MAWELSVDRRVCIGSGFCYGSATGFFASDGTRSRPRAAVVAPDDLVLEVAEGCPVGAITVVDRNTGATLAPSP
ncbi:ferredoxin [Amycolatopsis arida]|uniref:Ferredoxin n=1 Tax=Amycolatopsis arida TaxID=587909 RepID=A0A1I5LX28_9PSEU|nr:ferredoxin [Amycolatopsis arida]TDX93880.1 ferredoxin [Amycolatopsis arida]SFP01707.1 ferredoxin [Amycolatopsis arida]